MNTNPLWYRDAIFYEVFVRAFADANGDGIGDLAGLTSKLDYLQWLGVDAIWMLPIFPSPLRDDGYDVADYFAVHPDYGTMDDVRTLIAEAHRRGLRIIVELIPNHTSDQNYWFQASRDPKPSRTRQISRLVRVERYGPTLHRDAHHFPGHRAVQLDLRSGARPVFLAPLLQPPARSQL